MELSNNRTINISQQFSSEEGNRSSVYCQFRRDLYHNLDFDAKVTLIVVFSVTGIFGVLFNMIVVFAIHKTNQLAVQSIKLFRILSILDALNSIFNFFHLKVMLVTSYQIACDYYYVLNFVLHFGIYNSTFMVAMVAFDRFLHVSYLQEYSHVFTVIRFKLSIAITLLLTFYQSCATAFSTMFNGPGVAGKYTVHLNVFIFSSVIFFHTASLVKLKRHNRVVANISHIQRF